MSAQEFGLWQAFHARAPFGVGAEHWRTGLICATIANYAGRMRGKNAAPAIPEDFMPQAPPDEPPETAAQWLRKLGS